MIKTTDKDQTLKKCTLKAPLIAQVVTAGGSWPKLLDRTTLLVDCDIRLVYKLWTCFNTTLISPYSLLRLPIFVCFRLVPPLGFLI